MAYLSHFKYDIFISYARLNDRIPPGKTEGWVTRFHRELEFALSQNFERDGDIKIWRDTKEMDESVLFGEAIPECINESGLFLAVTSKGFITRRGYCHKELTWFHGKAQQETYGLAVNNRSRIINVLYQNIPSTDWLPEMPEHNGFHFNDKEGTDEVGMASDPDGPLFQQQLRKLVDALTTTLQTLKAHTDVAPKVEPPPPEHDFTVFLAHTEGDLEWETRNRVLEDLRIKNVQVITDIPPPDDADRHEQRVRQEMERAGLCIHLLDGQPGRKIRGDAQERTYYRRQVELGMASGKPQLIYVPEKLEAGSIENVAHRDFLSGLETGGRERATYKFIRRTQPGQIALEILQEIERIKTGGVLPMPRPTALLDIHEKDYEGDHGLKLLSILQKRNLGVVINPTGDGPQQDITIFDGVRKLVKVLIIVLGHVSEMWASSRLNLALQGAPPSLRFCGIYVPQPDRPLDVSAFQIPPDKVKVAFFFTPEQLNSLLLKYL
jgi:hypothetical protein